MTTEYKALAAQQLKWASAGILLIAMIVTAAWGVYTLPTPIVDGMLEADIRKQSEMWKRRVLLHIESPEATFQTSLMDAHDQEFLELMPEASDVYRFKLFHADGTVFWSTRPSDIGSTNTKSYFSSTLKNGEVYYTHEEVPASEIDDLILHSGLVDTRMDHHVAEVFVPVMQNNKFLGAIEFYTDITELRETFIWRVRLLLGALCGVALTAMTIVTLVLFRTNRNQVNALRARSQNERELMDEQLRLAREVRLLGELNEWLQSSRSLEELFDMVAKFMTHILPDAEGSVYVYSNSRDVLDGSASWNGGTHKDHIHPDGCWGLRRGRTYEYGATEVDFVCEHAEPHDGRPYFCFPILAHGETVGLMHLRSQHDSEEQFAQNKKLAQMCAEQISMAIANVRMRDQLHDQSVRDPLTGLYNRRHMTDQLRKLISRSQASGAPVSLIAVDVDHFKKFNDNHGHDAGDMVLRAVGSVLQQSCDGDEIACRMGGEEFTLILPGSSPSEVQGRAEKLRKAVEDIAVRYGEKTLPRITISLGIAHYPTHGTMPQDLMRSADDALYDAKAKGRNQVRIAALAHQAEDNKEHPQIAAE
ncbi:sensor domain-containing diguanylate cyclase [Falsiruegeria mediterranea]|uniref:diguanylate cyclase n=1 Tax=Falsiruegeria mediterranea M17 TaxID=1200281 RepID=A0A2R8C4N3_9RHOB|nr:diguanylate cyclase [Falsiruegeria mediterranea]SPJ27404.1 Response regulator PleD [Falsiruegeria mediterranea M17]